MNLTWQRGSAGIAFCLRFTAIAACCALLVDPATAATLSERVAHLEKNLDAVQKTVQTMAAEKQTNKKSEEMSWLAWFDLHSGIGTIAQWAAAVAALATLFAAIATAWWATKQWRVQYLANEWYKTFDYISLHSQFQDSKKNDKYESAYTGDELRKYELVARRSIAYVDDLFHLQMGAYLRTWLKGAVDLFVRPHYEWFKKNKAHYDGKFIQAVEEALNSRLSQ